MVKVFVYGTLMEGGRFNKVMVSSGGKKLSNALITGHKLMLITYPTVVEEEGSSVKGEVWQFNGEEKEVLLELDRIESYPHLYDRKKGEIEKYGEVWIYFMQPSIVKEQIEVGNFEEILGGDWKNVSRN